MDPFNNLLQSLIQIFVAISLYFFLTLPHVSTQLILDHKFNHRLIYNQCPNQSTTHESLLITALFKEFMAQSSQSKFSETIVADSKTTISGTFQCRNDLTTDECRNCVSRFPQVSKNLCGKKIIPSRIQLLGCSYAHFQEDGTENNEEGGVQILHRKCSIHKLRKNGFEEMKNGAFLAMENGVMNGDGFYKMTNEYIHLMAQCSGNLKGCECGECVSNAVEIAENECKYSVSGEVYLDGCFLSYEYYGDGGTGSSLFEDIGIGGRTTKLVAIVIGAALLLGVTVCFFLRSWRK